MSKRTVLLLVVIFLPVSFLLGYPGGVFPSKLGSGFNRQLPACGMCHTSKPNAYGTVAIQIDSLRSIVKGSSMSVTFGVTGGPSKTTGGFSLDSNVGVFTASTGTRVGTNQREITHSNNKARKWSFQFRSDTTGLATWYATAMASNGSGTGGDSWGFWGPDTSVPGTPYRIFVNDTYATPIGTACPGTKGFPPILGMATNAAVGKTSPVELHNARPGVIAVLALGTSSSSWGVIPLPFDLGLLGAKGCKLLVSPDLMFATATLGSGDGNGTANWPLPVPADTRFRGVKLYFQSFVFDKGVNPFGMITSNGLQVTVQ